MSRIRTYCILLVLLVTAVPLVAQQTHGFSKAADRFVPGFLYVRFTPKSGIKAVDLHAGVPTGHAALDKVLGVIGVTGIQPFLGAQALSPDAWMFGSDRTANVTFSGGEYSIDDIESMFAAVPEVEMVGKRLIFKPCYQPNDPHFANGDEYGLNLMSVPAAWNTTKGSASVVIAVLDEGTNYTHEDLIGNLQLNSGEMGTDKNGKDKRTNGIDDDGDGYVDNWHGWDLAGPNADQTYRGDSDPMPGPGQSHGTFVAGCAAATTDNGLGVAGVGFNCHYVPIKCAADSGKNAGNIIFGYEGIRYAATHGARVINCSWGADATGATPSDMAFFNSIIDSATAHNALVVAAAGNNSADIDTHPFIPAALESSVLSVGASDENDKVTGFSNYGHRVDVFAPGANIWSCDFPSPTGYTTSGGTSFSAPYVAGIAGLLASKYPTWTPKIIKSQIVNSVDALKAPTDRNKYWGRANAASALVPAKTPSLVISTYSVDGISHGGLGYLNKQYTLSITFKNILGNSGNTLSARLVRQDGYSVQQASASLGTLNTDATASGIFKFTRDSTDDGETLPMVFYVTDGNKYKDSVYLTLAITGDAIWVDKTPPNLTVTAYSVDGTVSGPLAYINKQYDLSVTFKNTGASGALQATLVPIAGYTVQSPTQSLGTMATDGIKSADFRFTRDSSDDGKTLPMDIYVLCPGLYSDTLHVTLAITGNAIYVDAVPTVGSSTTSDLRIAPNPATTVATAYFNLAHDAGVTFTLSDLLGRTVSHLAAGTFGAGANRYDLPLAGLAPGVYFVALECSSGEVMKSRIVIH